MANEIAVSYTPGLGNSAVTADVFQPDGTEREFAVACTEVTQNGLYIGSCATIVDGDLIVAYHGTAYIGSERYDSGLVGTVDTVVDAVLVDTGTTIPATITTAQNDLDAITGASGVLIDTDAVDADAIKADAIAEINATVDAALSDIKLDHLVAVADSDDVANSSIIAKLASSAATPDWSTFVNTTDSLQAARDAMVTLGAGAITFTYTLTNSVGGAAIADADIWATSDEAGTTVLASGRTNSDGEVVFYLDAGTVYIWRQKTGWNFTNPDTETVA